jgi:hypothetical protein
MTRIPLPFPGPLTAERFALRTPDDVARMLQLHSLGWGVKRIANELGCAKSTVEKYVVQGDWRPPVPANPPPSPRDARYSPLSPVNGLLDLAANGFKRVMQLQVLVARQGSSCRAFWIGVDFPQIMCRMFDAWLGPVAACCSGIIFLCQSDQRVGHRIPGLFGNEITGPAKIGGNHHLPVSKRLGAP